MLSSIGYAQNPRLIDTDGDIRKNQIDVCQTDIKLDENQVNAEQENIQKSLSSPNKSITTFPWNEGFEGTVFPPDGWTRQSAISITWLQSTALAYSGSKCASHNTGSMFTGAAISWLVTPQISVPATGDYLLGFWSFIGSPISYNTSEVYISTDSNDPDSGDFQLVKLLSGDEIVNAWRKIEISLNDYSGEDIYIAFRYYGYNGHQWNLDDVAIFEYSDPVPVPETVDFGSVYNNIPVNASVNAIIKNTGGSSCNVIDFVSASDPRITVTGDFPIALPAGANETFNVSLVSEGLPSGAFTGSFIVSTDAPGYETVTFTVTATIVAASISDYISEGFEDSTLPAGWDFVRFEREAPAWGVNSSACIKANISYIANENTAIALPCLVNMGDEPVLKFMYRATDTTGDLTNPTAASGGIFKFNVYISEDLGVTYTSIHFVNFYGHTATLDYTLVDIDVSDYANKTCWVKIEFQIGSYGSVVIRIDDIMIGTAPEIFEYDAELAQILTPAEGEHYNLKNSEVVKVLIKNNGEQEIADFELKLELDGVVKAIETYQGSIESMALAEYTFAQTLDLSAEGTYEIKATVTIPNDEVPENDSRTITVINQIPEEITLPWFEDFETIHFPPIGWTEYYTATTHWEQYDRTWAYSGTRFAAHNYDYEHWGGAPDSWLITPQIELPADGEYKLEFYSYIGSPNYYPDGASEIFISTGGNNPATGDFQFVKKLSGNEIAFLWQKLELSLADYAGESIYIAFRYTGNGAHMWYIDDVHVFEYLPSDGAVPELYGNINPMVNEPFVYRAFVENVGASTMSNYTVKLIDQNNNELATNTAGASVLPGAKQEILLYYTPSTTGVIALRAVLEWEEDANPDNDISPALIVNVQAWSSVYTDAIGTGTTASNEVPWNFLVRTSAVQTLYLDHELMGREGAIVELNYWYDFAHEHWPAQTPLRIYLANTELTELSGGWIPQSNYTMVFNGMVTFNSGQDILSIELDEPFIYEGKNLAILTVRPMDTTGYGVENVFRYTTDDNFKDRLFHNVTHTSEFNWTQNGVLWNRVANVTIKFDIVAGSATGTVTDGTSPVEGAKVQIVGSLMEKTTDATGNYTFPYLQAGSYQFEASKHGYTGSTSDVITVADGENAVVPNLIITPIPTFFVSGKVTGNNAPAGLENVEISLTGYDNYHVTTNTTGDYFIEGVYNNQTYKITATANGYTAYIGTVSINNGHVTHSINLVEYLYRPVNVIAKDDDEYVTLSWDDAGMPNNVTYQYDDGIVNDGTQFNPFYNGWLGNEFNTGESGLLTSIDVWGIWFDFGTGKLLTVDIFDGNKELIGTSETFGLAGNDWVNVELPNIPYNGDFYVMIHWAPTAGFSHMLGISNSYNGPEKSWIIEAGNWKKYYSSSGTYTGGIFMIRANANIIGKSAVTYGNDYDNSRALQGYRVFRLLEGTQESEWALLGDVTDNEFVDSSWETVAEGKYQYAVKAKYSGDLLSNAAFSNTLEKENVSVYTVTGLQNIVLYPNPFTNEIIISDPFVIKSVSITNIMGQNVKDVIFNGKSIATESLNSGIYFVTVESITGERAVYKMVK